MALAGIMLLAGKVNAQVTFHAGWQNASMDWEYDDEGYSESGTAEYTGFYAGATYDIDLGMASLYVTPGAELSYCTWKGDGTTLKQIDLRIRLWGRWNKMLSESTTFGLFAGPSINVGVGGNMYDQEMEVSKFDLGLTFGAQIVYNKIGFEAGYNLGLLNRDAAGDDVYSIKFNTLFLGLNYSL